MNRVQYRIGQLPTVVIGGKSFNVNQLIDKTLIARRDIPVYRGGDLKKPFAKIKAGNPVGIVYAWLDPTQTTTGKFYWSFDDAQGRPYYAEHQNGWYDLSSLRQQGALTTVEQQEQAQAAQPKSWQTIALNLGITAILVFAGVKIINNAISKQ